MKKYRPMPDLLESRVILVTGAGDGIGKTAAKSFAAHGATVVLLGRTVTKLEAVYDEIEGSGHPQPAIYPMNLEGAAPKDYQDLADTLEREFGRLDGLLHNATNLGSLTPLEHYDLELWAKVMQVNLHAPFLLTRACRCCAGRQTPPWSSPPRPSAARAGPTGEPMPSPTSPSKA